MKQCEIIVSNIRSTKTPTAVTYALSCDNAAVHCVVMYRINCSGNNESRVCLLVSAATALSLSHSILDNLPQGCARRSFDINHPPCSREMHNIQQNDSKSCYAYGRSKPKVRDTFGLLEKNSGSIISDGFKMA